MLFWLDFHHTSTNDSECSGTSGLQRAHVTPLFISLHWLPVAARIKFKTLMLAYRTTTCSAPAYFHSLLRIYIPSRSPAYFHSLLRIYIPSRSPAYFHSLLRIYIPSRSPAYFHSLLRIYIPSRSPAYFHSLSRIYIPSRSSAYFHSLSRIYIPSRSLRSASEQCCQLSDFVARFSDFSDPFSDFFFKAPSDKSSDFWTNLSSFPNVASTVLRAGDLELHLSLCLL